MIRIVVPMMALAAAHIKPMGRAERPGYTFTKSNFLDKLSSRGRWLHAKGCRAHLGAQPPGRYPLGCILAPSEPSSATTADESIGAISMSGERLSDTMACVSRRNLLRVGIWTTTMCYGLGTISSASAYTLSPVKPNEKETYSEAQNFGNGPLRILWVGPGDLNGVYKNLFLAGNEVVALDLSRPDASDLSAATTYATEHGYRLRFEQGDATNLKFADATFDVVVSSMFLCQDFNPEVVVSEIRRVLKPGGRFGWYEHVEDIDKVIVGKVFGERSIVRVQALPERTNVVAGVARKV